VARNGGLVHVHPMAVPCRALRLGQSLDRFVIPDAGQVRVFLPVLQGLGDGRLRLGRTGFEQLRPDGQLGAQPAEGLPAEPRSRRVVESGVVPPVAAPGQRGGAGGVVANLGLAILGQFGVGVESFGQELCRGPV
jgi:hypothetical protein